jgi:glucokinase
MDKYIFGVDIGGTTVKIGLFDEIGDLQEKWEIQTRKEDAGANILPDIADSIKQKMHERDIDKEHVIGVGVGTPGPVDEAGNVIVAVNLGWTKKFNMNDRLADMLDGIRVRGGNDANVAALGEMWKGGGLGYNSIVAVTLGTGVGGGIIVNGRMLTGATGAGGEIGHIHVDDDETDACNCGNYGCLEEYASATGIVRLANRKLASCDTPSVLRTGEVSAKTVFDAVKAGDKVADEIAKQFGGYLGKGLAVIAAVVNPEAFVIGGGVSKAGEIIFRYIQPAFDRTVFTGCSNVAFALAKLGNDAGMYGACKLVLDCSRENRHE